MKKRGKKKLLANKKKSVFCPAEQKKIDKLLIFLRKTPILKVACAFAGMSLLEVEAAVERCSDFARTLRLTWGEALSARYHEVFEDLSTRDPRFVEDLLQEQAESPILSGVRVGTLKNNSDKINLLFEMAEKSMISNKKLLTMANILKLGVDTAPNSSRHVTEVVIKAPEVAKNRLSEDDEEK